MYACYVYANKDANDECTKGGIEGFLNTDFMVIHSLKKFALKFATGFLVTEHHVACYPRLGWIPHTNTVSTLIVE